MCAPGLLSRTCQLHSRDGRVSSLAVLHDDLRVRHQFGPQLLLRELPAQAAAKNCCGVREEFNVLVVLLPVTDPVGVAYFPAGITLPA